MKKIILLFALFVGLTAFPQQFPGADLSLLIGKDVRVKPLSKGTRDDGYTSFYSDTQLRRHYKRKDAHSARTEAEHLEGRVFHVATAEGIPDTDYASLKLVDPTSQETIYYKYYTKSGIIFKLEIVGNEAPAPMPTSAPVATSASLSARSSQSFPGEQIELLQGKTLKVLPKPESLQKYGYEAFYADANLKKVYKKSGSNTSYEALVGKELKVVSYEAYVNSLNMLKYKLLLQGPETGNIYFNYDPKSEAFFAFEVIGGLDLPADFYCNTITSGKADNGEPFYKTKGSDGIIFKRCFNDDGIEDYFIRVNTPSLSGYQKGLSLQFNNNVRIERADARIEEFENGAGGTAFMAMMLLTKEEIEIVKNNEIVKTKIGNVESDVITGSMLKSYFTCLVNKIPPASAAVKSSIADCDQITLVKNTNTVLDYVTPEIEGIYLNKITDIKGHLAYLCTIKVPAKTKLNGTGAMVLFDNGDFFHYTDAEVVEKTLPDGTYQYITVFVIKDEDLNSFVISGIKGLKVAGVMKIIDRGADIQKLSACLINK